MKKLFLLILLFCCVTAVAQRRPDSYNYTRGVEAYENSNYAEAYEYFTKEINDNAQNGYAYLYVADIQRRYQEYGSALSYINYAVKYIPRKDAIFKAIALGTRALTYLTLGDTNTALKDLTQAIDIAPDFTTSYEQRADVYYYLKRYAEADRDYSTLIALDESNLMGYMGKGRNLNAQKRYIEAIQMFDHVLKLYSDYSSGYAFRAESYIGLKQYSKALDDVIKALSIDGDDKAWGLLSDLTEVADLETIAKLKIQRSKEPTNSYWDYCLGIVYEIKEDYAKAIDNYKAAKQKEASPIVARRIALCYQQAADYHQALSYINTAIQLDTATAKYKLDKATILNDMGNSQAAIAVYDGLMAQYPEYGYGYLSRGSMKYYVGDREGALEDYTMAIVQMPDYAYAYFSRGRVYHELNQTTKAEADFKKAIELDEKGTDAQVTHYCYFYLGQKRKAIECLNMVLANEDAGNLYNAACLYSLMGDNAKAIDYLRKSFEKGYRSFRHIERDFDLNNIRNTDEFKALIAQYQTQSNLTTADPQDDPSLWEEKVVELPFTKQGGLCHVKCTVNGLPLSFIFDSGASIVTISNVEAAFMFKNGYIQRSDFGNTQYFTTADGSISEGTNINLRTIQIGDLTLENVNASVVKSLSAPLLLGQTVLSCLGKIEIDNEKMVLRITHRERKK